MKQLLSITLAFTLVRLISQPGAAQQAQPSPTPGGRGGRGGRGGGTPPPIQAKPEELAKIKEKAEWIDNGRESQRSTVRSGGDRNQAVAVERHFA